MSEGWPTKKKRLAMNLTWFVAIAVFAGTIALVVLYNPRAVTTGDLQRLERGMTESEVRAILGEPTLNTRARVVRDDPETVWTYTLAPSHWSVTKVDYAVKFYNGKLDSWYELK
jgi:hypothetical protein